MRRSPHHVPTDLCLQGAATIAELLVLSGGGDPPLLTFVDGWVDDAKLLACVCVRSCVPACILVA